MTDTIIQIAAKALKMTTEEVVKNSEPIEGIDAYYFWNPVRGGNAVIVGSNGEKLGATSAVSFDRHLKAYISGKRN